MLVVPATLFRVEVTLKVSEVPLSETVVVDTVIVRDEIEIQVGTELPSDFCNESVSV